MTQEQRDEIRSLSQMHEVRGDASHRIVNAYRTHILNRYICSSCPSALWEALRAIKELNERLDRLEREEEERLLRERTAEQAVEEYKSASDASEEGIPSGSLSELLVPKEASITLDEINAIDPPATWIERLTNKLSGK